MVIDLPPAYSERASLVGGHAGGYSYTQPRFAGLHALRHRDSSAAFSHKGVVYNIKVLFF